MCDLSRLGMCWHCWLNLLSPPVSLLVIILCISSSKHPIVTSFFIRNE